MTEPGSETRLMVRGYEVVVRTTQGLVLITCPELPQFAIQGDTLDSALALTEEMIGAILTGRLARREQAH